MENIKILQVLKSLNAKELRRLGEFVMSPFFNKNKPIIKLFEALKEFHPGFNVKSFNIENIFKKAFPGEAFNYNKFNNVASDLYKLSEEFLAQQHIESKEYYLERNLFRVLRDKMLYKIYEQKHAAYMKKLINRKYRDEDYFYYLYEMNDEYLWYATIKKPNAELNILQTEFDNFFRFALIRMLRFYNLMLHESNQSNINYRITLFGEILEYVSSEKNEETPAILVFKTILLLLHTKDKKYYTELWKLKELYLEEFKFDDQHLIYIHLHDFAAYMVNFMGEDSYNKDMLLIYKESINNKLMTPQSFLYPNFMNVVKVACREKEFSYAEKFMKEFDSSLPQEEKINVREFCYGTIENAKGNFENALKHFSKVNFQNFIFKLQVKIVLLKIYYKLGMYEQALGIIDTFRHYIDREKNILPEHREAYNTFLILLNGLIKLMETAKNDAERDFKIAKLKEEAGKIPANPFRIKVWLIEELNKINFT